MEKRRRRVRLIVAYWSDEMALLCRRAKRLGHRSLQEWVRAKLGPSLLLERDRLPPEK